MNKCIDLISAVCRQACCCILMFTWANGMCIYWWKDILREKYESYRLFLILPKYAAFKLWVKQKQVCFFYVSHFPVTIRYGYNPTSAASALFLTFNHNFVTNWTTHARFNLCLSTTSCHIAPLCLFLLLLFLFNLD